MVRNMLKQAISKGLLATAGTFTRHIPKVLMYHKFESLSVDKSMSSAALFEEQLLIIKKLNQQGHNIQITVDDGYADFYTIAFPLLKKHQLQATFYVTTGFVNNELWMWYDQVEYLFEHCSASHIEVSHPAWPRKAYSVNRQTCVEVCQFLKTVETNLKLALVSELATAMAIELPTVPPAQYAPCTWEQLIEMDQSGLVTIGGHSHTHPILTQLSPEELDFELAHSKKMLEQKLGHEVHEFCYPNGTVHDYSNEVIKQLKALGYKRAVTAFSDGYNVKHPFHLRRFGGVHSMAQFNKHVLGVEYLSQRIRGYQKGRFKATMPK